VGALVADRQETIAVRDDVGEGGWHGLMSDERGITPIDVRLICLAGQRRRRGQPCFHGDLSRRNLKW
jgi:hypothetical protein